MLLSLPLCYCPHFSLGLECLFPISPLGQCLLISQEPVEFLPLSEAFPDPLVAVPLLHGSPLKFLAHYWLHVLSLPVDSDISLTETESSLCSSVTS